MDIVATVRELIRQSGMKEKDIAQNIGISIQSLSYRLGQGSLTAKQFFDICEVCGAEARIILKKNGKEIWERDLSEGRRVRRLVGGIVYDTEHAIALGNNFKTGQKPMREAYRDSDGNYFFADYYREGDMIVPSNGDEVTEFLASVKQV